MPQDKASLRSENDHEAHVIPSWSMRLKPSHDPGAFDDVLDNQVLASRDFVSPLCIDKPKQPSVGPFAAIVQPRQELVLLENASSYAKPPN